MPKQSPPFKGFSPLPYPQGSVTQFFGENPNLYKSMCFNGSCMCGGHNGWDCVATWGTPILAITDGVIIECNDSPTGYGKHVRILQDDEAGVAEWTYGHLSRIDAVVGQSVASGEVIGLMGNTGFVVSGATPYWKYNPYAGTHVHITKRPLTKVIPGESWNMTYVGDRHYNIADYNNGELGAVDPIELKQFAATPPPLIKPGMILSGKVAVAAVTSGVAVVWALSGLLQSIGL